MSDTSANGKRHDRQAATSKMKTMRTRCALATLVLLSSVSSHVFAWGDTGHEIIAALAQTRLTATARNQIIMLLGTANLASVSTWADQVRNQHPETFNWHFVDIPKNLKNYDRTRDCSPTPRGDCIIAAIARMRIVAADKTAAPEERAVALKFLVHLYGDLHQPLHCTDNMDHGGSDVIVTWFGQREMWPGRSWTLHAVWDYGIIEHVGWTEQQWVASLKDDFSNGTITVPAGDLIAWAEAAHALAITNSYDVPASLTLGQVYQAKNLPVVRQQLALAAARLADALNDLIGK